jgi:hypothetical protein
MPTQILGHSPTGGEPAAAADENNASAGAKSVPASLLHSRKAAATGSLSPSMQLSGPHGRGRLTGALLLSPWTRSSGPPLARRSLRTTWRSTDVSARHARIARRMRVSASIKSTRPNVVQRGRLMSAQETLGSGRRRAWRRCRLLAGSHGWCAEPRVLLVDERPDSARRCAVIFFGGFRVDTGPAAPVDV